MQVKVANISVNKVYPHNIQFLLRQPKEFKLTDLNSHMPETVCFSPDEIRSFIFMIEPKDSTKKINKFNEETLGYLELQWSNYFGDPGYMKVGPLKYFPDQLNKLHIEIRQAQEGQKTSL